MVFADVEPPLPEWNAEQRARILDKTWMPGGFLLSMEEVPGEGSIEVLPLILEEPVPEEVLDSEDGLKTVPEEFLGAYFEDRPEQLLVDPQGLLGDDEVDLVEDVLDYHAGDSSIDMYVYVFGADQHIPGDVREEEVVERLYSAEKPALLIYYFMGDPQRTEIYLSPVVTEAVSAAEQRRALKSSVVQGLASEHPGDQLKAFLQQMSIRIYWMERMVQGTAANSKEVIPDEVVAVKVEPQRSLREVFASLPLPSWIGFAGRVAACVTGAFILISILFIWWRSRVRFRFPECEIEPRLGGEHAAGIGAVISFSSAAVPPARQRDYEKNF